MFNEAQQAFYVPGSLITICILFLACLYLMVVCGKWAQAYHRMRNQLAEYASGAKFVRQQVVIADQHHQLHALKRRFALLETYTQYLKTDDTASYWIWQPEGENHPESMVSDLTVLIRAEDLKTILKGEYQDAPTRVEQP